MSMEMINGLFNIASLLTLSGFSGQEQYFCTRFPVAALILLIAAGLPAGLIRGKKCSRSELITYAAVIAAGAACVLIDRKSADAAALVLMLTGGCCGSIQGGVGVGRIIDGFILMGSSVVKKGHPNAVVTMKRDGRLLPLEKANLETSYIFSYITINLLIGFVLSFETENFASSLLIAAAATGNCGWIMLLCCGTIYEAVSLSAGMKIFLLLIFVPARLQSLLRVITLLSRSGKRYGKIRKLMTGQNE